MVSFLGNLGMGLDQNVISAYYFLSNNYDEGDEIFLFGFSRGSYTVRIVADLVAKFGVIDKEAIDRFPVIYDAYSMRTSDAEFDNSFMGQQAGQLPNVKTPIKVLGVWDTVGSMGFPQNWPWILTLLPNWWLDLKGHGKPFRDANLSSSESNLDVSTSLWKESS
jgi:uncharacterized protein (DUF2235 family)